MPSDGRRTPDRFPRRRPTCPPDCAPLPPSSRPRSPRSRCRPWWARRARSISASRRSSSTPRT
ncbi:hypothetical protein F0357_11695 [Rhizobiales bacterium Sp-1]|uniref:Uncharacterized protein n=1 Tax=Segnochrobactrum spirostomi TaxID=2608987 RepID=A0A6A7Y2L3_9HYPH|nr:hypothetical protein [Segnochrobactrum spirostomi]